MRIVSDGYLETLGLRLIAGRDFTEHDTKGSDRVIIINETLARTLWPGRIRSARIMTQDGGRRVIGLVGDVRHRGLEQAAGAEMYIPIRQSNNYNAVAPGGAHGAAGSGTRLGRACGADAGRSEPARERVAHAAAPGRQGDLAAPRRGLAAGRILGFRAGARVARASTR